LAIITEFHPDFQSALKACGGGYDAGDIADVIAYKTKLPLSNQEITPEQAANSILGVAVAAANVPARPLRVLDFGGGCGFHFFRVTHALRTPMRWAVVETASMAARAREIADNRFDVFTTIDDAERTLQTVDLVHASSAIQYVNDPKSVLGRLAALKAPYFLLARFPLWHGKQTVGVQVSMLAHNGIGPMPPGVKDREVKYPITLMNFSDLLGIMSDYEPVTVVPSPSSDYVLQGQRVPGLTLILRRR